MMHIVKPCALIVAALWETSCTGVSERMGADARPSEGVRVEGPGLVTLGRRSLRRRHRRRPSRVS